MPDQRIVVTCPACDREETFAKVGDARAFIERHRTEAGHEATWELPGLAAGDEAGVCGRPDCTTAEFPLYQGE